jgi:hypothetical protein
MAGWDRVDRLTSEVQCCSRGSAKEHWSDKEPGHHKQKIRKLVRLLNAQQARIDTAKGGFYYL